MASKSKPIMIVVSLTENSFLVSEKSNKNRVRRNVNGTIVNMETAVLSIRYIAINKVKQPNRIEL